MICLSEEEYYPVLYRSYVLRQRMAGYPRQCLCLVLQLLGGEECLVCKGESIIRYCIAAMSSAREWQVIRDSADALSCNFLGGEEYLVRQGEGIIRYCSAALSSARAWQDIRASTNALSYNFWGERSDLSVRGRTLSGTALVPAPCPATFGGKRSDLSVRGRTLSGTALVPMSKALVRPNCVPCPQHLRGGGWVCQCIHACCLICVGRE